MPETIQTSPRPGGDGGPAIGEEVEAAEPHPRFVRILERRRQRIEGVRILVVAAHALGGDGFGEAGFASFGERGEVDWNVAHFSSG